MQNCKFFAGLVILGLLNAGACRGNRSDAPPVHLNHNMDFQNRYDAQEENDFFRSIDCVNAKDSTRCFGRAARKPPEGTVAVGHLKVDDHMYRGRGEDGRLVDELPKSVELNESLLGRGEERYKIYCAPCHGLTGNGDGIATKRGGGFAVKPANYHDDRLRAMPLGYLYKVIAEGQGTMKSYASQIPVEDRWAIAAWVRVLQVSQSATSQDVPPDQLAKLGASTQKQGGTP